MTVGAATSPTGLEIFRARLEARLYLFSAGEIDDLHASMDELLVDAFRYAAFVYVQFPLDDILEELVRAWSIGGDRALKESKNAERLRQLSSWQLDELERRIEALKANTHVGNRTRKKAS